jgi:beta-galactosidase
MVHSGKQAFLAMTDSDLVQDADQLHLRSTSSPKQQVLLLPPAILTNAFATDLAVGSSILSIPSQAVGIWTQFNVSQPTREFHLTVSPDKAALPRTSMDMGPPVAWRAGPVPQVPEETAFSNAATWQLDFTSSDSPDSSKQEQWMPDWTGLSELFLEIQFTGDIAHLQAGGTLLDDTSYNGQPWEIGLSHLQAGDSRSSLTLSILPMPGSAPIYLDHRARQLLRQHPGAQLLGATLIPQYESVVTLALIR